jgi:hypothetical protein
MARTFSHRLVRGAVLGAGLLLASTATVGVASATESSRQRLRPVTVTFVNDGRVGIAACVFGSGGRCTNGGVAPSASAVVADPFNRKQDVRVAVFRDGQRTSTQRTVAAEKQLCATVTNGRNGSLDLRVTAGVC